MVFMEQEKIEGILLIDKPIDKSSFFLVKRLRSLTKVQKIGHAGTLDPFATGLMVLLIGKNFTKLSDQFLHHDKAYETTVELGYTTPSFDKETEKTFVSSRIPTIDEIKSVLNDFQGTITQTPPMFSAKKIEGKPLYELARKGITIERKPCTVSVKIELISYIYPQLKLKISCSKGTYIRSLGNDIGEKLKVGAYLSQLRRIRSGDFLIERAVTLEEIENNPNKILSLLIKNKT